MKVCVITATKNRHTALERSIKFFLEQTYSNSVQLIYNNSCNQLQLDNSVPKDRVILVNNCKDLDTNLSYTNLGDIYKDAIKYVPEDTDIVSFWDDDDIFLRNHIEEGVKGLLESGKKAYKPQKSYYRGHHKIVLVENTLEPSIFVKFEHIKKYGFSKDTTAQHLQWVNPLVYNGEIFVNPEGIPTLCYNWGDNFPTFKTSGDPNNPENFNNYEKFSKDVGDGIITPVSNDEVEKYYNQIK